MSAILGTLVLLQLAVLYMASRNQWVYRQRIEMIYADHAKYRRLVSYDAMLWRFWVWDVAAFEKPVKAPEVVS